MNSLFPNARGSFAILSIACCCLVALQEPKIFSAMALMALAVAMLRSN